MVAWVRFHADSGRTVIIATERTCVEVIDQLGNKGFMIFWHTVFMGWVVCWKHGIEKTVEFASTYETNVTDLHGSIRFPWTWLPQSMSVRRILKGQLFAKDVIVGHRGLQDSMPVGARWVLLRMRT